MNVSLQSEIEQIISRQVQSGRYSTAAEVIRKAVLLLDETERLSRPANGAGAADPARRSVRGLLADIRSGISASDIQDARDEMWAAFPRDRA